MICSLLMRAAISWGPGGIGGGGPLRFPWHIGGLFFPLEPGFDDLGLFLTKDVEEGEASFSSLGVESSI